VPDPAVVDQYLKYLEHVRHLSANTVAAYRRDIESFQEYLARRGLPEEQLPEPAVRGFVAECSKRGLSSRSINRLLSALRGYYRFRQKVARDSANPFRDVRSLRTDKPLPSFLFEEEVARLLDREAGDFWQLRDRLILELLYSTGCRVSELTAIDLQDLAPRDGSLRVRGKGGKERLVFVGRPARELLREYLLRRKAALLQLRRDPGEAALLLNRRGGRLSPRGVEELLKTITRKAALDKPVSPHTFRHSFATHILNRGADIRVVQELLGHASLSTTQVYTHLDVEGLRRVYEKAHPHARNRGGGGRTGPAADGAAPGGKESKR
jgi:tyrosine recombinase XerC